MSAWVYMYVCVIVYILGMHRTIISLISNFLIEVVSCWFQVLDAVLGHDHVLFRRAQLKALVSMHSQEVAALKKKLLDNLQ